MIFKVILIKTTSKKKKILYIKYYSQNDNQWIEK